jgi:cytochrome c-type biogenesis protein CcsB
MTLEKLQTILIQISFISLFILTLLSWIKLTIHQTKILFFLSKSVMILSSLCITSLLIIRWLLSNHLPLSNLYESSLFLAWSLTLIYFFLDKQIQNNWLDALIAPSVLITYTFATLGLPKEMQQSTALIPALQSNWLMMHVSMMLLSYGALLFGSLLSVTFLTLSYDPPFKRSPILPKPENQFDSTHITNLLNNANFASLAQEPNLELAYFYQQRCSLLDQLDYWSYRIIGIGFPLLTLGILSGAVWANEAWGSYWSWDPKETWALITWLVFAIYLHIRISQGWNGQKPALVASLGFFIVWMCYLGVNLLGKGLHSYGWFQ